MLATIIHAHHPRNTHYIASNTPHFKTKIQISSITHKTTMHCSISSSLTILLILTISLSFPTTPHASSSSTLIKKICSTVNKNFRLKSCVKVLQSEPRIVSATNLLDLSVGIIKSGISRSTRAQKHVKNLLKKNSTDPELKGALKECKSSYDWAIGSFNSALGEVKEKEYETATYDLLLAGTDCIQICEKAVAAKGIADKAVLSGNKVVRIFGLCAFEAVNRL